MHNYTGTDEFTYKASDLNGISLPATVTILVDPVPPVADPKSIIVPHDTPGHILFSGSDNDNLNGPFTFTFATTSLPSHGTLGTISGNAIVYTPNHDYAGPDSFMYRTTDKNGISTPALVKITVLPIGAGPPSAAGASPVPTLGTWGLITLGGLIGLTSVRRKRKM
jgi:hypothetical protein